MKLLELTIQNIRGIPDFTLKPNGRNMVICGPNGSGKSSIIDAIDFLFTGQISRMVGRGTGGITLQEHGVHLNAVGNSQKAYVSGSIQLIDNSIVVLKRYISESDVLICDGYDQVAMESLLRFASNGQHVLTRQRILQYVTEQPKDRAEKIQALLGLTNLEDIRASLVKVKNSLEKDYVKVQGGYQAIRGQISSQIEAMEWVYDDILIFINQQRAILGADAADVLSAENVRRDLSFGLRQEGGEFVNPTILESDMNNLRRVLSDEFRTRLSSSDGILRTTIGMIRADARLLHELSHQQLVEQGIKLIDDTGACPLCQTVFTTGELRRKLETRLAAAQEASRLKARVDLASRNIVEIVDFVLPSLNKVIAVAEQVHDTAAISSLQSWYKRLTLLKDSLQQPIEQYMELDDQVGVLFSPFDLNVILHQLRSTISTSYPTSSPEQTAYDRLTQIEALLGTWREESDKYHLAKVARDHGVLLYETFLAARDKILGELYSEIRQRFEELYRLLHGPDEANFISLLEPDEAGLNFKVNFHGRGMHPPHALHSEGHQDSMGICLFLALAERLTKGKFSVTLLDDVVMSVDAEHRKNLCRVLRDQFQGRQFIIATHDEVWARYLKSMGVVQSSDVIELLNWDLSTGPSSDYQRDIWLQIDAELQRNDVPAASSKLRRWAEAFFRDACDNLAASVVFQSSGNYSLGDFLSPGNAKWTDHLKEAKKAANSYNDTVLLTSLEEEEISFKVVRQRIEEEQWVVNATVHYNQDITPHVDDFRSIVDAFKQLSNFYICSQCNQMIHTDRRLSPERVVCTCGRKMWNLAKKKL